jgi:hypothetical protein
MTWGAHEYFMHPIFVLKNGCDTQLFYYRKSHVAMKKEKEKSIGKNGQVSKILKQWVLRCPPKKREKDSP